MMKDHARLSATLGIWAAVACIFIFGLFDYNFSGEFALFVMLSIGFLLAAGATLGTLAIWYAKPQTARSTTPENDVQPKIA